MAKSVLSSVPSVILQDRFRFRADVAAAMRPGGARGHPNSVARAVALAGLDVNERELLSCRAEFASDVYTTDGLAIMEFPVGVTDGEVTEMMQNACVHDAWFESILAFAAANRGKLDLLRGPIVVREVVLRSPQSGPLVPSLRFDRTRGKAVLSPCQYNTVRPAARWMVNDADVRSWRFLVRHLM